MNKSTLKAFSTCFLCAIITGLLSFTNKSVAMEEEWVEIEPEAAAMEEEFEKIETGVPKPEAIDQQKLVTFLSYCDYAAQAAGLKQLREKLIQGNLMGLSFKPTQPEPITGPSTERIIQHIHEFLPEDKIIVIATEAQAPKIAEATKKIYEPIHSIILLDPTVATGWLRNDPIKFNYEKITNRIYNFYSEYHTARYRKITPAMGLNNQGPYLKAVNIKCIVNTQDCDYKKPAFFEGRAFAGATLISKHITEIIHQINTHYKLNSDLTCYYYRVYPASPECQIIPPGNSPFLTINRFVTINNNNLAYVVTKGQKDLLPISGNVIPFLNQEYLYNSQMSKLVPYSTVAKALYGGNITLSQWNSIKNNPIIKENQYARTVAQVRLGDSLCSGELDYLINRKGIVRGSLSQFLGRPQGLPDNKLPKIAIVASGGGIRAMLATLGALKGLEQIGLLNGITYISALSGSSWALALWLSTASLPPQNLPEDNPLDIVINDVKIHLTTTSYTRIYKALTSTESRDMTFYYNYLIKQAFYPHQTQLIDLYGRIVARTIFPGFLPASTQLSQQQNIVGTYRCPFPIYTAINYDAEQPQQPDYLKKIKMDDKMKYHWYEVTPYEVGASWIRSYVPTWAFGRKFVGGFSQDQAPEETLATYLGTFGSAICAPAKQIVAMGKKLEEIFGKVSLRGARFWNFAYGISGSIMEKNQYMDMADAGIAFNLPYPPVSSQRIERKADIVIFIDASADSTTEPGLELKHVATWAEHNEISFPSKAIIKTYEAGEIRNASIKIFREDAPQSGDMPPLVIYLPLEKDPTLTAREILDQFSPTGNADIDNNIRSALDGLVLKAAMLDEFSTFKFDYTPGSEGLAQTLMSLMQFNVWANAAVMRDAINSWLNGKELKSWFLLEDALRIEKEKKIREQRRSEAGTQQVVAKSKVVRPAPSSIARSSKRSVPSMAHSKKREMAFKNMKKRAKPKIMNVASRKSGSRARA